MYWWNTSARQMVSTPEGDFRRVGIPSEVDADVLEEKVLNIFG